MLKQALLEEIYQLDLTDAIQLNNLLVKHIKQLQKTYCSISKLKFSCGDYINFMYDGTKYTGVISKKLNKYARINIIDTSTSLPSDTHVRVLYSALSKI